MRILLVTLTLLVSFTKSYALTWDEPWHDKVVKESNVLILAKIVRIVEKEGVYVQLIKNVSGIDVPVEILISDFYLLEICSWSGNQTPEFRLGGVDSCYFFLKKSNDTFRIATPTSGFAPVKNGKVTATYRHSYHQTLVEREVFEKSQEAIFNHYHNLPYNTGWVSDYIKSQLSITPSGFEEHELMQFFHQHVALELIYHLQLGGYVEMLMPFIRDTHNRHNQISAARALKYSPSKAVNEILFKIIKSESEDDFLKVICIWSLSETESKTNQSELKTILQTASENSDGFGGNIMDNRVCTRFPSVKQAINEIVK